MAAHYTPTAAPPPASSPRPILDVTILLRVATPVRGLTQRWHIVGDDAWTPD